MSNEAVPSSRALGWVRPAAWSFAAALLALPAVAMQFTSEVNWTLSDFIIMGALIGGTGFLIEVTVRLSGNWAYRAGGLLALLASFFMIWVNLAVGIIGSEDNPLNAMFAGVLGVALVGTILVGFRARGMRHALVATAVAQLVVGLIATFEGHNIWPFTIAMAMIWSFSAALFNRAAQDQ